MASSNGDRLSVAPSSYRPTSPALSNRSSALLDHSHLRPGKQAALLSHERTLQLYRANAKKSSDPEVQYEFASFLLEAAKEASIPVATPANAMVVEKAEAKKQDMLKEATTMLKKNADKGHTPSQYLLADCYANGLGTQTGKQDFDKAYPLFLLSGKRGHPDGAYRAAVCCENGWGCKREAAKAVQFYKRAAAGKHPGAMYRLGIADLNGELNLPQNKKEGINWLKRSCEHADQEFPHALHELGLLHTRGVDQILFKDDQYAAELFAQAAELGYAPSAYYLGESYDYGDLGCPQDAALALHYYNIAAQQNHRDACFALTPWYLVGAPGILPQSDTEALLWARKAAEAGLTKGMYAVGYFFEVGIGAEPDIDQAVKWFERAAKLGDGRAAQRLQRFKAEEEEENQASPMQPTPDMNNA